MLKLCPHCGRVLRGNTMHIAACPERPDIQAALRAALTGKNGCMVRYVDYTILRARNLPSRSALTGHFGSWGAVAAHFGLRMGPQGAASHKRNRKDAQDGEPVKDAAQVQAEIDAEVEATMHVSRAALDAARYCTRQGMPVATHQDGTPYARAVAGGGVAYMLR
jgi:hypothetical protein